MSGRVSGGRASATPHPEFKVVVLGESQVGKTCLVLRYIEGFYSSVQQSTVGAFFLTKKVTLADGASLKIQLWDTAGQERFHAMAPMYYRNAHAAIVAYDPGSEASFAKARDWVDELQRNTTDKLVLAVVATKSDMPDVQKAVTRQRGQAFAEECGGAFFEASAMQDTGVRELFQAVSQLMWDRSRPPAGAEAEEGAAAKRGSIVMTAGDVPIMGGGSSGSGGGCC